MSTTLNLVVYPVDDGDFIEEGSSLVSFHEVTPALLDELAGFVPLKKTKVYYDLTRQQSFEIACFDNAQLDEISNVLRRIFRDVLSHENAELNLKKNPSSSQAAVADCEVAASVAATSLPRQTDEAIARMRMIIGIVDLFNEKRTKWHDKIGAVVK
jgi:hypothetical protein